MKFTTLGHSEVEISKIIVGCWQAAWKGTERDDIVSALRASLDAGVTTFDTAEGYGGGLSEQIVAEAFAGRRDEVVIATKVSPSNLEPGKLKEACDRSLRNLNTDRIDLYQIHWPSGAWGSAIVPIEDSLAALSELKSAGKIRAIGVSNFNAAQLTEALEYSAIDSLQPPYSLFWRQIETDVLPVCEKNGITVLAYSPLAQGLLTGKFDRTLSLIDGDVRKSNVLFKGDHYERVQQALDQLRPIASRLKVSLGNLALAWLLHIPNVCPIVGARNAEQAEQNVLATEVLLTDSEWAEISEIGEIVTDHLDDNPVLWR